MSYDGFYGELSSRGTANDALNKIVTLKDKVVVLAAEAEVSATNSEVSATTSGIKATDAAASAASALSSKNAAETSEVNAGFSEEQAVNSATAAEAQAIIALAARIETDEDRIAAQQAALDAGNAAQTKVDAFAVELAKPDGGDKVGVQQNDSTALKRSIQNAYRDTVRIEDFVAYGDGRDEGAALQKAITFAAAQNRTLVCRRAWVVGTSVQINIPANMSYQGNGMQIRPVGRTSGTHIKISGFAPGVSNITGLACSVSPNSVGTLTGVQLGDTEGEISSVQFRNWEIRGFAINLKFAGNNVFILNFHDCVISGATGRNISWECLTNSGENICFSGGTISDAKNATNTAVGLFIEPLASAPDMRLSNLSMSYNDFNGDIGTGIVEVIGVHEENRNTNPFWRVRNTVRREKSVFTKVAGTMSPGPLSAGKEPDVGRDAYIVYDGSTAITTRDVKIGNFHAASSNADFATKIAKHSGVGGLAAKLSINGFIDANRETGLPPDVCPETSLSFLTGTDAFDGVLKNTAAGITFVAGTDGVGADTRSRSIIGAGANSGSYNIRFNVTPLQNIIAKLECKTVGATACTYAGARIIYYTANDFLIASTDFGRVITTPNNAAYVTQFIYARPPAGTAYAIMQMLVRGLTGEVRFTNERLWVMN